MLLICGYKESVNGTIELEEDEVFVVKVMLHFMYQFDYDADDSD